MPGSLSAESPNGIPGYSMGAQQFHTDKGLVPQGRLFPVIAVRGSHMSDFLTNSKSFETAISRGPFSYRSKRLDAVVAAIHTFIQKANQQNLDAIKSSWKIWSETDAKEYKDRGERLEADLKIEIRRQEEIFHQVAQLDQGQGLRKVIWIPGSFDPEMDKRALAFIQAFAMYPRALHGGGGELRFLLPTTKLYILCHGDPNMPLFLTHGAGSWSASELADMLAADGLKRDHKDIELLVCYAGESVNTRANGAEMMRLRSEAKAARAAGDDTRLLNAQQTFAGLRASAPPSQFFEVDPALWLVPLAGQLATALRQREYTNFRLVSYKCPVAQYNPDASVYLDLRKKGGDFGESADEPKNLKYRAIWH